MKQLAAILMVTMALTISGCASSVSETAKVEYLTYVSAGQPVPVKNFTDSQGNHIDLTESHNAKLLVLFATWCPDSQRAMKALQASDLILDPNLDIIGIGREENKEALDKFANEYQINFPLVADSDRSIYAKFANAGVPRLILLDGENHIVKAIIAEGDNPLAEVRW
ncbi:TlpA family protein disulfide reductase [Shewanella canadensis]|uniref:TlpA family protein disulfide reductase n=1 Tax=Shewanella canadensis TaxID=271096 RepID=A0A431WYS6_9GAMM|nr:TlpA disulfide reductase family protein [Shewanella canadensis]RTR40433.1 TlpA family protein disulfide reductase [Shewanella canadensis]